MLGFGGAKNDIIPIAGISISDKISDFASCMVQPFTWSLGAAKNK